MAAESIRGWSSIVTSHVTSHVSTSHVVTNRDYARAGRRRRARPAGEGVRPSCGSDVARHPRASLSRRPPSLPTPSVPSAGVRPPPPPPASPRRPRLHAATPQGRPRDRDDAAWPGPAGALTWTRPAGRGPRRAAARYWAGIVSFSQACLRPSEALVMGDLLFTGSK